MTTLQAAPSVTLAEALHRLEETGGPVILRDADGKDCAALVSLPDLQRLSGGQPVAAGAAKHALPPGTPALAPDGLPWPEGYFDRPPRVTLEEAIRTFGIRPSCYYMGRPSWTPEERRNPAFRWPYPPEPVWASDLASEERGQVPEAAK
jgi:hypothetical protein